MDPYRLSEPATGDDDDLPRCDHCTEVGEDAAGLWVAPAATWMDNTGGPSRDTGEGVTLCDLCHDAVRGCPCGLLHADDYAAQDWGTEADAAHTRRDRPGRRRGTEGGKRLANKATPRASRKARGAVTGSLLERAAVTAGLPPGDQEGDDEMAHEMDVRATGQGDEGVFAGGGVNLAVQAPAALHLEGGAETLCGVRLSKAGPTTRFIEEVTCEACAAAADTRKPRRR